jgi:ABC-2 type transport system permease protein
MMVTPIRRWEFILGKTVPFFLVGCVDAILIAAVGTFWFGVPLRGDVRVLAAGLVAFIFAALGMGLLLSTVSATQQQAMISAFFFNMPMITLSGFGTPIASMPPVLQKVCYLNPLRHVMVILRDVYLKGSGFNVLWPEVAALAGMAILLLTISVLRFHKSLE